MSYLDWHVGMKVVCVNDQGFSNKADESVPQLGSVYTIRSIFSALDIDGPQVGIYLVEIVNPVKLSRMGGHELGWRPYRFRPAHVRKTSIEVFKRLLTPSEHDKHLIEVHDFVSLQGDLQ